MATRGNTTKRTKARTSSGGAEKMGVLGDGGSCLGTTVRRGQGCSHDHVNTSEMHDVLHEHDVRELREKMGDNHIHVHWKVKRLKEASGQNHTNADDDGGGGKATGAEECHCCCCYCCCCCHCLRGECTTRLAGQATTTDATKGRIQVRAS